MSAVRARHHDVHKKSSVYGCPSSHFTVPSLNSYNHRTQMPSLLTYLEKLSSYSVSVLVRAGVSPPINSDNAAINPHSTWGLFVWPSQDQRAPLHRPGVWALPIIDSPIGVKFDNPWGTIVDLVPPDRVYSHARRSWRRRCTIAPNVSINCPQSVDIIDFCSGDRRHSCLVLDE